MLHYRQNVKQNACQTSGVIHFSRSLAILPIHSALPPEGS